MILAGDIGGTTLVWLFSNAEVGNLRLIAEHIFPSRDYKDLGEIVSKFLKETSARPEVACFGIAGPVHNGRVRPQIFPGLSNSRVWRQQIQLPATLLDQ